MGEVTFVTRRNTLEIDRVHKSLELKRPKHTIELRPHATIAIGGPSLVTNTFTQPTPSALWTVTHNLGRKPMITLKTLGTTIIEGQIDYVSDDEFTVTFNTPQAGQALYV